MTIISFPLHRDSTQSVLSELRNRDILVRDVPLHFAASIPTHQAIVLDHCSQFAVGDSPLIFWEGTRLCIHAQYFSSLNVVMVDKLDQRYLIGAIHSNIPIMELVKFLITSDIILTYKHIGSEMTLTQVSDAFVQVKGLHRYFTQEEHTERFAFVVELTSTGNIYVSPMGE